MPPRNKRLTVKEQILDWFDRNPGSKARSGPLAKALKMGSTTCADALAKLAADGKLSRIKTKIDEGSGQGTRPEQWEYSIPAPETVAQPRTPTPFKPLGAQPRVYRRHSPAIENAPSVMTGPVHAPAHMFQEPQPAVGQNTGSLASGGYPSTHAPEGQADHKTPVAEAATAEPTGAAEKHLVELTQAANEALDEANGHIYHLEERLVKLTQKANEAQARADDLDKALDQTLVERDAYHDKADQLAQAIAEYFGADIGEHSSGNCPWDEALNIITESDTGKLYSPTIEAKAPEAYAVVAPKKPIQRFSARHNAEKAATAAARAVGSAEIFELHRIAKASRGAVVIREA